MHGARDNGGTMARVVIVNTGEFQLPQSRENIPEKEGERDHPRHSADLREIRLIRRYIRLSSQLREEKKRPAGGGGEKNSMTYVRPYLRNW